MAKRINFWELPIEDAQSDDTVPAYRGRGQVARVRLPDGGGGDGTVTSVGVSMPTGFEVSNSPITSSGTIAISFAAGYGLPTTAAMGQWSTAFGWGDHAQAGYALASGVTSALAGKVDKVAGKGLSTEDYTTSEKSKLTGIEEGAQVNTVTSVAGKTGAVTLIKGDVGLGSVDNTSDADKPISTAVSVALSGKVDTSDARLTNSREWTASTVPQAEAEAGAATTRRAWTAQRVWQAITAWWNASAAKDKLDNIQTGATANQTDAYLLNRANHTGTQAASTITGLGTAATADTTTSDNDPTAGRVLKVGDFGLGATGNIPNSIADDLDRTDRPIGFYSWRGSAAGEKPPVSDSNGTLIHTGYRIHSATTPGNPFALQIAASNMDVGLYFRQLRGANGWASWKEIFHTGNFDPDSKVDTTDSRLTNSREWTASAVSQSEAEAGTSTTARKWTAQRVRQNVAAYSYSKSEVDGLIAGGGVTAEQVKILYESNPNTNAFTDSEKSKLDAAGTNANRDATISTASPSGGNNDDIWYQVD